MAKQSSKIKGYTGVAFDIIGKTEIQKKIDVERLKGEAKDCSVTAVAIVCGVSYDVAHVALAAQGRKDRHGLAMFQINAACHSLGFKVERIRGSEFIDRYPARHLVLKHVTTHHPERFPEAFEDEGPLLLYTSNHVAAFRDGVVHCWSRGQSLRVTSIYRVTPV